MPRGRVPLTKPVSWSSGHIHRPWPLRMLDREVTSLDLGLSLPSKRSRSHPDWTETASIFKNESPAHHYFKTKPAAVHKLVERSTRRSSTRTAIRGENARKAVIDGDGQHESVHPENVRHDSYFASTNNQIEALSSATKSESISDQNSFVLEGKSAIGAELNEDTNLERHRTETGTRDGLQTSKVTHGALERAALSMKGSTLSAISTSNRIASDREKHNIQSPGARKEAGPGEIAGPEDKKVNDEAPKLSERHYVTRTTLETRSSSQKEEDEHPQFVIGRGIPMSVLTEMHQRYQNSLNPFRYVSMPEWLQDCARENGAAHIELLDGLRTARGHRIGIVFIYGSKDAIERVRVALVRQISSVSSERESEASPQRNDGNVDGSATTSNSAVSTITLAWHQWHSRADIMEWLETRLKMYNITHHVEGGSIAWTLVGESSELKKIIKDLQAAQLGLDGTSHKSKRVWSLSLERPANGFQKDIFNKFLQERNSTDPVADAERMSDLRQGVKAVFRKLTHPVVLITCRDSSTNAMSTVVQTGDALSNCRGATVSSFTTVSIKPTPVVSFNLTTGSRTLQALLSGGQFVAHILNATQEAASIANVFSQKREDPSGAFRNLRLEIDSDDDRSSPPKLSGASSALLARLECWLMPNATLTVGDHTVVLARVNGVTAFDRKGAVISTDDIGVVPALTYGEGNYRSMGEEIGFEEALKMEDKPRSREQATDERNDHGVATANDAVGEISGNEAHFYGSRGGTPRGSSGQEETLGSDQHSPKERKRTFSTPSGDNIGSDSPTPASSSWNTPGMADCDDARKWQANAASLADTPTQQGRIRYLFSYASPLRFVNARTRSRYPFVASASAQSRSYSDAGWPKATRAVLDQTVGEFLGPGFDKKRPGMKALLKKEKSAYIASQWWQKAADRDLLNTENAAGLNDIIARNERLIEKEVALRSAEDLTEMLDQGRVDQRKVQFLESSVEHGMEIMSNELKVLRAQFLKGTTERRTLNAKTLQLQRDRGTLKGVATRLKNYVEDEFDEGTVEDRR